MAYNTFVFDMDGTLLDTAPGIIESLRRMQEEQGFPTSPDDDDYQQFIGPPLLPLFQTLWGLSLTQAQDAMVSFRRFYAAEGIYKARIYDGVLAMLGDIRAGGGKIALATMKVEAYARASADHFGLTPYIDCLYGYSEQKNPTKCQLILEALAHLGVTDRSKALMVGDSLYDTEGAREAGVDFAAVHFGDVSALAEGDAVLVAQDIPEVHRFICAHMEAF